MTVPALIASGTLADVDLGELMEVTSLGRQLMRVELSSQTGTQIGTAVLKAGRIVSATAGPHQGQAALRVIFSAEKSSQFSIFREDLPLPAAKPIALVADVSRPTQGGSSSSSGVIPVVKPQTTLMEGSLTDFDVATLLETLSIGRQHTKLEVLQQDGTPMGSVLLKAGKVVSAQAGGSHGVSAVRALLRAPASSRFVVYRVDRPTDFSKLTTGPLGPVTAVLLAAQREPAARPPAVLKRAPVSQRVSVLEGLLSEFDVPTILQTVGVGRQSLVLEVVDNHGLVGTIHTKAGILVSASAVPFEGIDAVRKLAKASVNCEFKVFRLVGEPIVTEPVGLISQVLFALLDDPAEEPKEISAPISAPPAVRTAPSATAPNPLGLRDHARVAVMQGQTSDYGVRTLLEVLTATRQHTQVEFSWGGALLGEIHLKAGMVISANTKLQSGVAAFEALLEVPPTSTFCVYRRGDPVSTRHPLGSLQDLLRDSVSERAIEVPSGETSTDSAGHGTVPGRGKKLTPYWIGGLAGVAALALFMLGSPRSHKVPDAGSVHRVVSPTTPSVPPVVAAKPRIEEVEKVIPPSAAPPNVISGQGVAALLPEKPVAIPAHAVGGASVVADAKVGGEPPAVISVRRAQRLLNDLGYDCGPVDNMYGRLTRAAVRAFQRAEHLPVIGVMDPVTTTTLVTRARSSKR